jgi:hypothetical protein
VRGRSDRFDESDAAWLDQYAELFGTMTHLGMTVSRETADGNESKGALDTIVVETASADDLKLCADAWRAWLGRDDSRWIELTGVVGGVERSAVLRASDLTDGRFDRLLTGFYPAG